MSLEIGQMVEIDGMSGTVAGIDKRLGVAHVQFGGGRWSWCAISLLEEAARAKLRENVLKVGKLYGVACLDNEALTSESRAKELGSRLRWTLQGIENMARDAGVELRQLPESIRLACAPEDGVVEMRVEWRIK